MTTADDRWDIDIKPALAALKKLRASIGLTDKKAAEGFDRSAAASKQARDAMGRFVSTGTKGAKSLGASIGGLAGPLGITTAGIAALSAAFVALAAVATKAFIDIASEGVELNKQFETSELVFTNLFNDPSIGKDTLTFLRQTADQLRVNQGEAISFAQSILPRTGDIDTFRQLLKLTDIQADVTGKSISELEFPIREALSGDFVSLRDQFDLSKEVVERIKELGKEIGLDKALAQELTAEFERLGKADISGTLATDIKDINSTFTNLKVTLGEPIFLELKEQAEGFLGVLDEQGDEISFVASAFGDLAANVVDFVGSGINEFISSLDFARIERLVDAFNLALSAGQLLIDVLFELPDTSAGIDQATLALLKTQIALQKVAELAGKAKIALQATVVLAKAAFQFASKDVVGAIETLKELGDIASVENQEEAAKNTESAFARYEERIKSITGSQKERRKVEEEVNKAAIDEALGAKSSAEELEKSQAEAAKAQAEIDEKTSKAAEDSQKRLTDIQRKEAQKRFDDEIKNAQKREDIARKNADSIEDIFRKQDEAIADAGKDLSREEQDIALKGARERKAVEKNAANERIEVERNFRQQLQDIQRQFNQSAQDAERTNDAQAFLQAVRSRDEQIDVAKSERDVSLEDVGRGATEQRSELKEQLAQEVEDSKITNTRKVEDLQLRLNQELEAQAIKNERDLEAQAIAEQRQQEQRALAAQRTLENFERTEAEKQEKLTASLEKQFAILEAAKEKELALLEQTEAEKTNIIEQAAKEREEKVAKQREDALLRVAEADEAVSERSQTGRRSTDRLAALEAGPTRGLAAGDGVSAGESVVVGEGGPELFTAPQSGFIIPNQTMFSPPGAARGMAANVNNSRNLNVEQMGINPGNAILSRMVQNEMSRMMELLG